MTWRNLRRVLWAPKGRSNADQFVALAAVVIGIVVAQNWNSLILGLVVAYLVMAVTKLVYYFFTKKRGKTKT